MAIPRIARSVSVLRETPRGSAPADRIGRFGGTLRGPKIRAQMTIDRGPGESLLTAPAPLCQLWAPLRVVVVSYGQTQPVAGRTAKQATLTADKSGKSVSFQGLSSFTADYSRICRKNGEK